MKKKQGNKRALAALNNYFTFFLMVAFVITGCLSLFVSILTKDLGTELNHERKKLAPEILRLTEELLK